MSLATWFESSKCYELDRYEKKRRFFDKLVEMVKKSCYAELRPEKILVMPNFVEYR